MPTHVVSDKRTLLVTAPRVYTVFPLDPSTVNPHPPHEQLGKGWLRLPRPCRKHRTPIYYVLCTSAHGVPCASFTGVCRNLCRAFSPHETRSLPARGIYTYYTRLLFSPSSPSPAEQSLHECVCERMCVCVRQLQNVAFVVVLTKERIGKSYMYMYLIYTHREQLTHEQIYIYYTYT